MKPFMVAIDELGEAYIEQKPSMLAIAFDGLRSALWVLINGYEPKNQSVTTRGRR